MKIGHCGVKQQGKTDLFHYDSCLKFRGEMLPFRDEPGLHWAIGVGDWFRHRRSGRATAGQCKTPQSSYLRYQSSVHEPHSEQAKEGARRDKERSAALGI
ncbi:hypothetical protein RB25_20085 [Herbaspirillum rubrisubalbicans]|uniref:Uncharacterized protein n=2 Tax=Herbaspirillum rubrisubalbicans TaxID=80842 RepID=A0ABX9C054_9BURK|nr:hypothetical protein C798_25670 [Herbaspirillum rubrisubalbicans Os34]RAM63701.1 hypothetical protein RB24_14490 [Herbaspirillum rubrisubalbicans]RAN44838.1 hypothetical protein RB25_20085 [Herbaspirillum rubrisubalbicans]